MLLERYQYWHQGWLKIAEGIVQVLSLGYIKPLWALHYTIVCLAALPTDDWTEEDQA